MVCIGVEDLPLRLDDPAGWDDRGGESPPLALPAAPGDAWTEGRGRVETVTTDEPTVISDPMGEGGLVSVLVGIDCAGLSVLTCSLGPGGAEEDA